MLRKQLLHTGPNTDGLAGVSVNMEQCKAGIMRDVYIVSAARTAIGSFGGSLSTVSAVDMGIIVAKEAIERAGVAKKDINEVVIGNVLSADFGQNVARQIALKAGLPDTVNALSIDKVCGSKLRAVSLAAQMIKAGDADIVMSGGSESMSQEPFVLDKARFGYKMGDGTLKDTIISNGLTDAFKSL